MSGEAFRRWTITRAHVDCDMCARVEAIAKEEFSISKAERTRSVGGDHWVVIESPGGSSNE